MSSLSAPKPPPYVICYLCGRKYGTKSIAIHEPSCITKWKAENKKLPKHLRRRLPTKPDYSALSTGDVNAVDRMNEMAFQAAQDQLIPCENCGRTFYPERLPVHQRSCTADKPAAIRPRTVTKSRTSATSAAAPQFPATSSNNQIRKQRDQNDDSSITSVKRNNRASSISQTIDNDRTKTAKSENDLGDTKIPCGLCNEYFYVKEIGSHLLKCNEEKTKHLTRKVQGRSSHEEGTVSGSRKSSRPNTRTLHRSILPSQNEKQKLVENGRASKHDTYDVDSSDEDLMQQLKKKESNPEHSTYDVDDDNDSVVRLSECDICQRKFASDRLQKHKSICKKTSTKTRKIFDSSKQRAEGTDNVQFINKSSATKAIQKPKSNWKQTHEDFIRSIRAAKKVTEHMAKGGKASDLPPPPPSLNPNYVYCQYCDRRFNPEVAERHIPKCATIQNRPKPPNQKALDVYKSSSNSIAKASTRGNIRHNKSRINSKGASSSYKQIDPSQGYSSPRYESYSSQNKSTDFHNISGEFSKRGRDVSSASVGKKINDPYRGKTFSGIDHSKPPSRGYSYNAMNYTSPNFLG